MERYVALPMGEAAGVGPELIIKALGEIPYGSLGGVIVVGDRGIFQTLAQDIGEVLPFTSYVRDEGALRQAQMNGEMTILYDMSLIDLSSFCYGQYSAQTGEATFQCTAKAVSLIQNGYASALVTMPLDGRALSAAGHKETTYRDMLATFASTGRGIGMLDAGGVKIFTHTYQMPLRSALDEITYPKIMDTIIRIDSLTQDRFVFDQALPLAIATVNPHHADSPSFGEEEEAAIIPAVRDAQKIGIKIIGPVEGDHLMHRAQKGQYKAIIMLFHDQASIAAMSYDFDHTVLVVWGLPFLMVSLDRGAQLSVAGKGKVHYIAAVQALKVAFAYVQIGVVS